MIFLNLLTSVIRFNNQNPNWTIHKVIALSFLSQFFQTVVSGIRDIYVKDIWRRSAGAVWYYTL